VIAFDGRRHDTAVNAKAAAAAAAAAKGRHRRAKKATHFYMWMWPVKEAELATTACARP